LVDCVAFICDLVPVPAFCLVVFEHRFPYQDIYFVALLFALDLDVQIF
jgi:hypothetical protein